MAFYNKRAERKRKERETPERILHLAKARGRFEVSLRYRDDWLRRRCAKLKAAGLLRGGQRDGDRLVFFPTPPPPTPRELLEEEKTT